MFAPGRIYVATTSMTGKLFIEVIGGEIRYFG
jgi:hypothetical protein